MSAAYFAAPCLLAFLIFLAMISPIRCNMGRSGSSRAASGKEMLETWRHELGPGTQGCIVSISWLTLTAGNRLGSDQGYGDWRKGARGVV